MSSGSAVLVAPPNAGGSTNGNSDSSTHNGSGAMPVPLTGHAVVVRLLSNDFGGSSNISGSGASSSSVSAGSQPRSDNGCNERTVRLNEKWMPTPSCQGLVADIITAGASSAGPAALRDAVHSVTGNNNIKPPSLPAQEQKQKQKEEVVVLTPVDRATASIRLVQLLAALFDAINDPKRPALAPAESGANAATNGSSSALTGGEMIKLSGAVMTSLAGFVSSLPLDNSDDNDDADAADDDDSVILARYAFESAFRSLHYLVKARAQFLASIWRGLCDVAVAAASVANVGGGIGGGGGGGIATSSSGGSSAAVAAARRRSLHRYDAALSDAVSTLTEYVSEGTEQLERVLGNILSATTRSASTSTSTSTSTAEPLSLSAIGTDTELAGQVRHLVKMFVFLLARVATMAPIWLSSSSSSSSSSGGGDGNSVVLADLMNATARLKGLSVRLEIVTDGARRRQEGQPAGEAADNAKKHVLDPIAKLGNKCDGLALKTLLSLGDTGQQGDVTVVHRDGLNALFGVADDTRGESRSTNEEGGSSLHQSLALGKLFLLRVVLHKLRSSSMTATGDSKGSDSFCNIEASLSICEDVLFFTLPLCHSQLSPKDVNDSFGPSVFLDIVDLIADCTLRSELCCDSSLDESMLSKTDQTHMMLVRWLIPSNIDCSSGGGMYLNLHPLSREMVICVIHLHLLRLCALSSVAGRCPVDQYGKSSYVLVSASQLISLLCSILIDPRTAAEARQNVAAVLTRLLKGSFEDDAVALARNETVYSFVDAINVQASRDLHGETYRKAGRKRARKESKAVCGNLFYLARHWSAQELDAVGSVLVAVSGHALFWEGINDGMKTNIQQLCEKVSVPAAGKRPGSIGLVTHLLQGGASHLQILGIDLSKVHSKVIQLLSAALKDGNSKVNEAVPSLLRFVQSYMKSEKQSYPCHALGILAASLQKMAEQSVSEGVVSVCIMHAIASLLSQVGSLISPDCPREVLKSISSTFFSLFKSKEWPLVAETMSSLEVFLTTMPKVHSAYIPQCLPSQFQTFISSRMQENIFDIEKMTPLTMEEELRCSRLEEFFTLQYLSRARRRKLYARTDLMIEIDSTAVTLSKDGAVGAILIIPRGSTLSVEDILSDTCGLIPNKLGLISHAVSARDGSSSALQIEDKP